MDMSGLQVSFLISTYLSVSLWEVVMFQKNTTPYPYSGGFGVFSLIQWIAVIIGMIAIFGWVYGIIVFLLCLTVLQYLCHFTLGLLLSMTIHINYLLPTALFAIHVWVLLALGIMQLIF